MNVMQTVLLAAKSHEELLAEARDTLRAIGDCDHSVGQCCCGLKRRIAHGTDVQAELNLAVMKIERHVQSRVDVIRIDKDPLELLRRIEITLRGTDCYHIAMDVNHQVGLGDWIKTFLAGAIAREEAKEIGL